MNIQQGWENVCEAAGWDRDVMVHCSWNYDLRTSSIGENLVFREQFMDFIINVGADIVMKIGALEESITVSGQSPVVDTVSTTSSTTFQRELLQSTPRGRGLWDLIPLASGVST
jgi:hypothetical protein